MQITINNTAEQQPTHQTNGKLDKDDSLGRVRKGELVRLILQSLQDLGYRDAADQLQRDSGVSLESETVGQFRQAVLNGDWALAESLLSTLALVPSANPAEAIFLLRQQRFLELLEARKVMKALHVLRNELQPLGQQVDRLHELSSLILCSSAADVKSQAQWDGANGTSRENLLIELQRFIAPTTMIPKARLLTLINQAFDWQRRECLYHDSIDAHYSLFADHACDKNRFPSKTIRVLEGHQDEVWHIAFSHNGRYMASVSRDKTCIIWDVETFEKLQVLSGPQEHSSYCAWSPDDTKLLTCGCDFALRLWDPMAGQLLHTFSGHKEQVTSCAWLPDGQHFISGACDKTLCLWNVDGSMKNYWPAQRILDVQITRDGRRLVTISYEKCIGVYDINNFTVREKYQIPEMETITSLTLSRDGRYALVNVQESQEVHLWDLDEETLVRRYCGQKQGFYIIRSTLGGNDESFVLSGSEDNCVYVWSRDHQSVLEVLEGHTKTVNCISWYPNNGMMFASASDDRTIRIWGLPEDDPSSKASTQPLCDTAKGKLRI
ncbi:WD40-repeat-containing domain protein [Radiomyces spectabilis]|uniref:WD40-repeat-containing domain protein n=1 Tax=Radiomyces spectabilis TaxID=64574 RepID=UPI00221EFA19|nr:WD40-repeat-containing domain protein [Radiomyces spectabilis]KAI8393918.1 WD40-repeat-containing domain protein [Radiomyces spectabilis]